MVCEILGQTAVVVDLSRDFAPKASRREGVDVQGILVGSLETLVMLDQFRGESHGGFHPVRRMFGVG